MASSSLVSAMAAQLEDREDADYTLVCGEKVVKVHSFILAARLDSLFSPPTSAQVPFLQGRDEDSSEGEQDGDGHDA
jgi:hypothetical protein